MSKHESPMTTWYWEQRGEGTYIPEYIIVDWGPGQSRRLIDGLIILGEPQQRLARCTKADIAGKDVVVLQTKHSPRRLGMSVAGQLVISKALVERLGARSVEAIALVQSTDAAIQPVLESLGCKVIVCPPEICSAGADGLEQEEEDAR